MQIEYKRLQAKCWRYTGLAVALLSPSLAFAHASDPHASSSAWLRWNADPWVTSSIAIASLLYTAGLRRLWRNAGRGAGVPIRAMVAFHSGILTLVLALLSPIDTLGPELFSMHMVQHELLVLVAAPLIVMGRPLAVFIWAFPAHARKRIGAFAKTAPVHYAWQVLTRPAVAWWLHAIILWAWHFPVYFQASLVNDTVHAVQHASFFFSAILFWAALIGSSRSSERDGIAVIYVLSTAIHTGMLGALLTFSPAVWYPMYAETAPAWGFSALEDQQLGGLIMWVPAGFLLIGAGLFFMARMLTPDQRSRPAGAAPGASPRPWCE